MRLRLSMVSVAVVLLAAWLVLRHHQAPAPNPFVLQVPATYLSVGQQFQPQLVSLAPDASAATDAVTLTLWNAAGKRLATSQANLGPTASTLADPMSLPRSGSFVLRAESSGDAPQTITLHAMPDAATGLAGVLPVTSLGVAEGVADYLRQHGFVLTDADLSQPMPPASRVLLVGRPSGSNVAAQYGWLWRQVADGAKALLLQPPSPDQSAYWPLAPTLVPAPLNECGDDVFAPPFTNGIDGADGLRSLLHPPLQFDFSHDSTIALYHWNGYQIISRTPGYSRCHALVSFRLGNGWVSQTTLPLLQHFQDVRARIYLMNLIMASARRKHTAPASPGLAWVMQQRMKKLEAAPVSTAGAVYYRAAPTAIESAPVLAALPNTASSPDCWPVPRSERPGASFTLQLDAARAVKALTITTNNAPAYRLEASHDGRAWSALPSASAVPAGNWQAFRLVTTTASGPWQMCTFSAQ